MTEPSTTPALDEQTQTEPAAQASPPAPPAPPAPPPGASLREWLLREGALREARAFAEGRLSERQQRHLRYGRATAAEAARLLESGASASARRAALDLYRQAYHWALRARFPALDGPPHEALQRLSPQDLRLLYPDRERHEMPRLLVDSFASDERKSDVEIADELAEARKLHAELDSSLTDASVAIETLLLQRLIRVSVAAVVLAVLLARGGSFAYARLQGPDLALNRPWKASSGTGGFATSGTSQQTENGAFFHTNSTHQPWVEIDLGSEKTIRSVEVANRKDCCQERAVPLWIEVSSDQKTWQKIDKRTAPFSTWRLSFAPRKARWVRARLEATNYLHLHSISVR